HPSALPSFPTRRSSDLTDGIDGSEDNAGAVLLPDSLSRGARLGLDAGKLLADNDAYGFFSRLENLVVTGPTRTNVNDYRAILIRSEEHTSELQSLRHLV